MPATLYSVDVLRTFGLVVVAPDSKTVRIGGNLVGRHGGHAWEGAFNVCPKASGRATPPLRSRVHGRRMGRVKIEQVVQTACGHGACGHGYCAENAWI